MAGKNVLVDLNPKRLWRGDADFLQQPGAYGFRYKLCFRQNFYIGLDEGLLTIEIVPSQVCVPATRTAPRVNVPVRNIVTYSFRT